MIKRKAILLLFSSIFFCPNLFSQTTGMLTFTVTPTSHNGSYGSKHVVAIWIQDASGNFVKTSLRMASKSHTINNHLNRWKSKSSLNVVDAVTGSTLSSYSTPLSVTWNATNVSGTTVADGTYSVWIEESWDEGSSGTNVTSISFTKGNASVHVTPANTANFANMTLDWVPASTPTIVENINLNKSVFVYPNPSAGIVNINFDELTNVSAINIYNNAGNMVLESKINKALIGCKQIDMIKLKDGVYFVTISYINNKANTYKLILKK